MKNFLLFLIPTITINLYSQSPVSGILTHTNHYFTMNAYSSSYDDGSQARLFYDGNNKLIHFWNSDGTTQFTGLKLGNLYSMGKLGVGTSSPINNLDVIGVLGFRGINASNLPSTHWRLYFNASSTVDNGLQFRVNDELKVNFKNDTFMFDGLIRSKEIKVQLNVWSDFVFAKDYELPTLEELEAYILQNQHLPDIPSETEVIENGVNLGEMNAKLLQKIEELTLYLIEQNKQNKAQQKKIEQLEQKVSALVHKSKG